MEGLQVAWAELEDWDKTQVVKAIRCHEVEEVESDESEEGIRRKWVKLQGKNDLAYWRGSADSSHSQGYISQLP